MNLQSRVDSEVDLIAGHDLAVMGELSDKHTRFLSQDPPKTDDRAVQSGASEVDVDASGDEYPVVVSEREIERELLPLVLSSAPHGKDRGLLDKEREPLRANFLQDIEDRKVIGLNVSDDALGDQAQ